MGRKKQDSQDGTKKRWITPGKILTLVIGIIVVIYVSFSVRVFYNFVKLMITDPDAADRDVSAVTMLDTDEENFVTFAKPFRQGTAA